MVVRVAIEELKEKDVPEMMLEYYDACVEYIAQQGVEPPAEPVFSERETFIENWMKSDKDIYRFSDQERRRFNSFAKTLRAALPDITDANLPGQDEAGGIAEDDDESGDGDEGGEEVDVAMKDRPGWEMGGEAYKKVMDAKREVLGDLAHTHWVWRTITSIEEAVEELSQRNPPPQDRIIRLLSKITHMDEQEIVRNALKKFDHNAD